MQVDEMTTKLRRRKEIENPHRSQSSHIQQTQTLKKLKTLQPPTTSNSKLTYSQIFYACFYAGLMN